MAETTGIEWCDHTYNPWLGCQRVSPACDQCYAAEWARRWGNAHLWEGERQQTSAATRLAPHKWNRVAASNGTVATVFCGSLMDVADNKVPVQWRRELWHTIYRTPSLRWLLLTKRPQNLRAMLPDAEIGVPTWGAFGWANVWLGTTVENQAEADRRIPHLLAVPAAGRFLSCEPLLGPVDLTRVLIHEGDNDPDLVQVAGIKRFRIVLDALRGVQSEALGRISWVITGGESGRGARPMNPVWARFLRDQCAGAGVPFFFKQWGEYNAVGERAGKRDAGRLLDGVLHDAFPWHRGGGWL